jgi:hypothetical protein
MTGEIRMSLVTELEAKEEEEWTEEKRLGETRWNGKDELGNASGIGSWRRRLQKLLEHLRRWSNLQKCKKTKVKQK